MQNKKRQKYMPYDYFSTIYDIDYNKLYENNKKIILIDIDNTMLPYDELKPNNNLISLIKQIKSIGFKIFLISNNNQDRIDKIGTPLEVEGLSKAKKPFKSGYKKVFKKFDYRKEEYICIGDQLITDVYGAGRVDIDCILVKAIKRSSEKWYTKFNRRIEKLILKKIKKNNVLIYSKIIKER